MDNSELARLAVRARERAYTPYSGFAVGAALLCNDGSVFTGCNIENASFTPTVCAERTAVFAAVASGKRDFVKIAIAGGKAAEQELSLCPPCGVCRQVLSEFCKSDFEIILVRSSEDYTVKTLGELLPLSFDKELV